MNYKEEYFELLKKYYLYNALLFMYFIIFLSYQPREVFPVILMFFFLFFVFLHISDLYKGIKSLFKLEREIQYGR